MAEADFRDQVRKKLVEIFAEESTEDLVRVLHFLDDQDKACGNDMETTALCPYWKSLKALLKTHRAFEEFAKRLSDDTRTAENNPQFIKVMNDIYTNWMTCSESLQPEGTDQGYDLDRLVNGDAGRPFGFAGLAQAWSLIPEEGKLKIFALIPMVCKNQQGWVQSVDRILSPMGKAGGKIITYGLAAVYLCWEALHNIIRWWQGEISGWRCAKNIIDASITTAAGLAGGIGGAVLGTIVGGPMGTVVGGIVGGMLSANTASFVCDHLTQCLFDLPKSEALENAYRYLGVHHNASNAQINTAFRKLCLKHHPDKGGNKEEFFILQNNMAIIKVARGDV